LLGGGVACVRRVSWPPRHVSALRKQTGPVASSRITPAVVRPRPAGHHRPGDSAGEIDLPVISHGIFGSEVAGTGHLPVSTGETNATPYHRISSRFRQQSHRAGGVQPDEAGPQQRVIRLDSARPVCYRKALTGRGCQNTRRPQAAPPPINATRPRTQRMHYEAPNSRGPRPNSPTRRPPSLWCPPEAGF
jgi:hypothetical protein